MNQFVSVRDALRLVDPVAPAMLLRLRLAGMKAEDARQLSNYEAKVLLTMHPVGEDLGALATPWTRKLVANLLALRGVELLDPGVLSESEGAAIIRAFVAAQSRPKKYKHATSWRTPWRVAVARFIM